MKGTLEEAEMDAEEFVRRIAEDKIAPRAARRRRWR